MTLKFLQKIILGGFAVATLHAARAAVIFNLTPATLSTAPGGTVEFTGSLTNTGVADVFLNGDVSVLLYSTLTLDDSSFFANSPLSLAANGGSYSGPFFDVTVSPAALTGSYSGSFTIQGGADSSTFGNIATKNFQVNVTSPSSVPEPRSFVLVATAFTIILFTRKSFRHALIPRGPVPRRT